MDEATSALDTKTEADVTSAIAELKGEVTVISIAHRLSTIRDHDQLWFMRDGRIREVMIKLAERAPGEPGRPGNNSNRAPRETGRLSSGAGELGPADLGLTVIEIDESNAHRFDVPRGMTGLLVQRVEPMSAAFDASIERGQVILEINREPVHSVAGFRRVLSMLRQGDAVAVFLYLPDIDQKNIRTLRLEPR